MASSYEECVKEGGSTRTTKVTATSYRKVCVDPKGKQFSGPVEGKSV